MLNLEKLFPRALWAMLASLLCLTSLAPTFAASAVHFSLKKDSFYHNPNTGRFWTQDSYEGVNSDPASLHKYTYCQNNPANSYDPSGNVTLAEIGEATWIGARIGFTLGGLFGGIDAALNGQSVWKGIVYGSIGGGIIGAGYGVISVLPAAIGFAANITTTAILTKYGASAAGQSWGRGYYWGSAFRVAMLGAGAISSASLGARQLTTAMEEFYGYNQAEEYESSSWTTTRPDGTVETTEIQVRSINDPTVVYTRSRGAGSHGEIADQAGVSGQDGLYGVTMSVINGKVVYVLIGSDAFPKLPRATLELERQIIADQYGIPIENVGINNRKAVQ